MSRAKKRAVSGLILMLIFCLAAFLFLRKGGTTTVTGTVYDSKSRAPVYGAKISAGNKTTRTFLLKDFRLSELPRAKVQVTVTAPMYETVQKELDISKNNTINIPLRGKKIEGLSGVLVWVSQEKAELILDIRLTNETGETMVHYPSMGFTSDVKLYKNIGTQRVPRRGRLMYEGHPEIIDRPAKGLERLKSKIALNQIAKSQTRNLAMILDFVLHVRNDIFKFSRYDLSLKS